ncbi:9892_t:CDS:2 [Acaulospora morrowiae]|uniref:9892_t:CDS:1 n=1 Tax=Acaulospora morrowiae TaxID=94023 RepID=A0A9N9BZ93_9GLOM|nr:9892_t:CDS:2 [Acaulospora morrowiae]
MNLYLADEHDLVEFQRENKNHMKALNSQKTIADMLHIAPHKGIKKTKIHRAVVEWLIVDNLPLDTINGEGFCRFMLQIDPGFHRPSYKALKKEISFGNTNVRNQIYEFLEKSSEMPMPYPYTSQVIREFLIQKVQDFNLQDKILCVVTNNGSNMVAAIRDWDGIERLPYVPTHWNFKYRSWKRLIQLQPAIRWLSATLPFRDDPDAQKDGRKLQQLVLREEE